MTTSDATTKCQFCGQSHGPRCPTVKAIEYHVNGTIKRIEFMTPNDYSMPLPMYPIGPITFGNSVVIPGSHPHSAGSYGTATLPVSPSSRQSAQ